MMRSEQDGSKSARVEESVEGSRACEVDVVAHPDWQPHHQHNDHSFFNILRHTSTLFDTL